MSSEPVTPGDALMALLSSATEPVFLIAPFIKQDAMARLLGAIPADVPVTCVTRWRPDEVAAGVSDLEVFDLIRARVSGSLLLQPHLHAKLYRVGDRRLLGSANLSGRALGWNVPANLEILLNVDGPNEALDVFEKMLFATVMPASTQVRDAVAVAAAAIGATMPKSGWSAIPDTQPALSSSYWLPTCPRPDLLYRVYSGTIGDTLLANSRMLGENDLAFLEPPAGLSDRNFHAFIGAILLQVRWIQDLDQLTIQGLTDTVAAATIASSLPPGHDFSPEALWSVTKDWLMHFFPNQYDRVPAGEILRKKRQAI
jgi:phosphatidylserine/phosphatidylglycerophosphate/cardiolipin synthase-like enzyme